MKKVGRLCGWFVVGLASVCLAALQEHPSIAPGVAETPAKKLQEELGKGGKTLVIDVRAPKEYAEGHIPGATNIPLEELSKKIVEMKVPKDTIIITVCEHGGRSSRAVVELQKLGYKASSFCRLESWKKAGYKTETGEEKPRTTSEVYTFTCHHYCQSDKQTTNLDQTCECACGKPYRDCMHGD